MIISQDRNEITTRQFDDMHNHFRKDKMLKLVVPFTASYCGRAIAMPNTRPNAILTAKDVENYRSEIFRVIKSMAFKPLMTIEIRDNTTPKMVEDAHAEGAVAGKIYPYGVTTNADHGLKDFFSPGISETFRAMENIGMLLLIHGELDLARTLVTKREQSFLPTFEKLVGKYPKLNIVLEHISTKQSVTLIKSLDRNVAATITAHHLCTTLNDVIGNGTNPHNMCMPVPKDFDDKDALIEAATSANSKFFLGSDSAPWDIGEKECAHGRCGVFSAPILPQLLAQIFEQANSLEKLEDFTSRFGAEFYGLPLNKGTIRLVREEWVIPYQYGKVVPFMAGKKLQWQLR